LVSLSSKDFDIVTKRIEKDIDGTLWGKSHPWNYFVNQQDIIIKAVNLYENLFKKRADARGIVKEIDKILG